MSLIKPISINFAGYKVNTMESTASINIGDVFLQSLDSVVKNNLIIGNTTGDLDLYNMQTFGSSVFDTDVSDTTVPTVKNPIGLED